MNKPTNCRNACIPRVAAALTGLAATCAVVSTLAAEPAAPSVRSDPMYMAVFGGKQAVASIRPPRDGNDQLASDDADWPSIAAQWRPLAAPAAADAPR